MRNFTTQISGKAWKVRTVSRTKVETTATMGHLGADACCDLPHRTIYIAKDLTTDRWVHALLHEVVHAVLDWPTKYASHEKIDQIAEGQRDALWKARLRPL